MGEPIGALLLTFILVDRLYLRRRQALEDGESSKKAMVADAKASSESLMDSTAAAPQPLPGRGVGVRAASAVSFGMVCQRVPVSLCGRPLASRSVPPQPFPESSTSIRALQSMDSIQDGEQEQRLACAEAWRAAASLPRMANREASDDEMEASFLGNYLDEGDQDHPQFAKASCVALIADEKSRLTNVTLLQTISSMQAHGNGQGRGCCESDGRAFRVQEHSPAVEGDGAKCGQQDAPAVFESKPEKSRAAVACTESVSAPAEEKTVFESIPKESTACAQEYEMDESGDEMF